MKRFYQLFAVSFFLVGVVILFNYSVVYLSGEMRTYTEVISSQQKDKTLLYGCVFNNDYYPLKRDLYEVIKPEVLVAGSSRMLLYTQKFFTRELANTGLAIRDIHTATRFFEHVAQNCYPKTMLVGLDHWWFNEGLNDSPDTAPESVGDELTFDKLFKPILYYYDGKFEYGDVLRNYFDSGTDRARVGLRAIELDTGFLYDGSTDGPVVIRDEIKSFETFGMKLVKSQPRAYRYGKTLHTDTIDRFFGALDKIREKGVEIFVFFSPLYPDYYDYLVSSGKYQYVDKLVEYTRERYGVYSYIDPATLGLGSRDFYDMIHMQRTGSARLLRDLAEKEPGLAGLVDLEGIQTVLDGQQ